LESEIRINARGLSAPGPRLMASAALEKGHPDLLRVVVSSEAAAEDVGVYLTSCGASVEVDHVGAEFHVLARFPSR
jgi:TusA-related sulfurtransferase